MNFVHNHVHLYDEDYNENMKIWKYENMKIKKQIIVENYYERII